jgi:hypothetical protein
VPAAGLKAGVAATETVTAAWPRTLPLVAIIFALPCDIVDARPVELGDATAVLLEDQLTIVVTSVVLESLYTAVALNCCVLPTGTVVVPGETAIVCSVAAGTLTAAEP